MSEYFDLVFAHLCHQDPQRTIWIDGIDLTLCWRCAGLHLGVAMFWLLGLVQRATPNESILNNGTWPFLLGPFGMYLHWYSGAMYGYDSAGWERFVVGVAAGAGFGLWLQITARSVGLPRALRSLPSLCWIALMVISVLFDHQDGTGSIDMARTIIGASSTTFVIIAAFAASIMIPAQLWTGAKLLVAMKRRKETRRFN